MSLVDRAIADAGLDGWLARRLTGTIGEDDLRSIERRVASLDLLVLGALADRVRAREVGDVVRIHLQTPTRDDATVTVGEPESSVEGEAFMRRVAAARLMSKTPKISVRIDVGVVGVQIAQVALAFGANEIVAVTKRSLVGEDAVLREREIASLVRSAARVPRIVEWLAGAPRERDVDATTEAKKKFRAPGRDVREEAS